MSNVFEQIQHLEKMAEQRAVVLAIVCAAMQSDSFEDLQELKVQLSTRLIIGMHDHSVGDIIDATCLVKLMESIPSAIDKLEDSVREKFEKIKSKVSEEMDEINMDMMMDDLDIDVAP